MGNVISVTAEETDEVRFSGHAAQPEREGRDGRTTFSCRARLSRRALLRCHALSDPRAEVEFGFLLGDDANSRLLTVERADFVEPFSDALFHLG